MLTPAHKEMTMFDGTPMETMRIVGVLKNDRTLEYEVRNQNGTKVMGGQYKWMCTDWCRENGMRYIVTAEKQGLF